MDNRNNVQERIISKIDYLSKQILVLEKKNRQYKENSDISHEKGNEIENIIEMKIGELAMLSELLNNKTAVPSD